MHMSFEFLAVRMTHPSITFVDSLTCLYMPERLGENTSHTRRIHVCWSQLLGNLVGSRIRPRNERTYNGRPSEVRRSLRFCTGAFRCSEGRCRKTAKWRAGEENGEHRRWRAVVSIPQLSFFLVRWLRTGVETRDAVALLFGGSSGSVIVHSSLKQCGMKSMGISTVRMEF